MKLSTHVDIKRPVEKVWGAITDIKNCPNFIESIVDLEILDEPKDTLLGFKWKETRVMFGKEATETMWITDFKENEYYETRAESHGSVYRSKVSLTPSGDDTRLTMSFDAEPQSFLVKLLSPLMSLLMKGSMKKALHKDLNDIKSYLESNE